MITSLATCFAITVMCALLAFVTWVDYLQDLNSRYTLEQQPEGRSPFLTLEEQKRLLPPSE